MSTYPTLAGGSSGFFTTRFPVPWLHPSGTTEATSAYDANCLKATLEQLIDFDRINTSLKRLSVGAVNVRSGNFVYFDTATHLIRPEHIMASAALPPGFPAVEIEAEHFWDGALVSNTPVQWVVDSRPHRDTLAFQVDLWSARGEVPSTIAEVLTREKEIRYSSRTRAGTGSFKYIQRMRRAMADLFEKLPDDLQNCAEAELLRPVIDHKVYNIVHLVYPPRTTRAIRRITTSRAPACRSTGAQALVTQFAPCVIRKCLSAPRIMRASSRSISFATAANRKGLANVSDPERAGSICIRSRFRLPAMPAVAGGYAGLTVLTLRACPRVVL
jgi:predicted acylesterase/phospholipase RssA